MDRYGAARDELRAFVARRSDIRAFFEQLVASELEAGAPPATLPEVAVEYALEDQSLERVVDLERTLAISLSDLEDSRTMVSVLRDALQGEQRYRMFPGLRGPRDRMIGARARALGTDLLLLETEEALSSQRLSGTSAQTLDQLQSKLRRIADEIRALPASEAQVVEHRQDVASIYEDADHRAYQLTYKISGMRAQLVAIESWLARNEPNLSSAEKDVVRERVERSRGEIESLERKLDRVLDDLRISRQTAEAEAAVGGLDALQREFDAARDEALSILREARTSLSTEALGVVTRFDQQRQQLSALRQDLAGLEGRIKARIAGRVASLQEEVAREAAVLERLEGEYAAVRGESRDVIEPLTEATLGSVDRQLGTLLREADVGLIDVAWARKQSETRKVDGMIKELQQQTLELEEEFADVLGE
ncbi:MAG: hypothetical protein HC923_00675 [Myxococcales bacterium]|nr:hypothetical protein [Myxococcales bacterium]